MAGLICLLAWAFCPALWAAAPAPKAGAAPEKPKPSGPQALSGVRLGTMPEYSRLVFTFTQPMENYKVRRADTDEIWLDFGPAQTKNKGRLNVQDALVQGVAVIEENGRLQAKVKLTTPRFSFRDFVSPDRVNVVVDFRPPAGETPGESRPESAELNFPGPDKYARTVRASLPEHPKSNTAESALAKAVDNIIEGKPQAAVAWLEKVRTSYPNHQLVAPATILLGDAGYLTNPQNPSSQFNQITSAYQEAINSYPDHPEIARVKLMMGLIYMNANYHNEAVGFFKLVVQDHPQSPLALIARIFLGELYLQSGKKDQAKEELEAVIAKGPKGELALKAYYTLGQAHYQEKQYTQALEAFKEILHQNETFYLQQPELLHYMGESYYQLGRMELARAFLYHALNLDPDQKNADLIMVRIGETYKEEQKNAPAVAVYTLTSKLYANTPGAMISHIRLAEYGALRYLFKPSGVFPALEEGTPAATLKMYKQLVETEQDSPLIELATFKMAQAYLDMEEYETAINLFKDLMTKYPKSSLMDDIKSGLNQALVTLARALYTTKKYEQFISLYNENQLLINQDLRPEFRHYLAMAYTAAGNLPEALRAWQSNKEYREHLDERWLGIGRAYLQTDRFQDAVKYLTEFRKAFPKHPEVVPTLLEQARKEFQLGLEDAALSHFEEAIKLSPPLADDGQVMKALGQIYLKKGNTGGGLSTLKKALDILKDQPEAQTDVFLIYSHLGQTYAEEGRKDEAETNLDAAIKIRPKDAPPETLYVIAGSYKKLGLMDKYKSTLELLTKSNSALWRDLANRELKPKLVDPKVDQLLGSGGSPPPGKQPAPKTTAPGTTPKTGS